MIIKANEIVKYMEMHNVDKVPVEVVNTDVPESKELGQGIRHLAKRLIITGAFARRFDGRRNEGAEAVRISYVMYNSFKKSQCYVPPQWEFDVLAGEVGTKILKEFAEHGGNLEQVFRNTFAEHNPEIQAKLAEAAKLIKDAENIAEEHGIPFSPEANIMQGMPTGYVPESFESIFGELKQEDSEVIYELTHTYNHEYTGWQNSSTSC